MAHGNVEVLLHVLFAAGGVLDLGNGRFTARGKRPWYPVNRKLRDSQY
jgi:hypothetical protein